MAEKPMATSTTMSEKKLLNTREAAEYLGIDYCNFRRARNLGYFGACRYPAPRFLGIGSSELGLRYRKSDLDDWLDNYPTYSTPTEYFQSAAGAHARKKGRPRKYKGAATAEEGTVDYA